MKKAPSHGGPLLVLLLFASSLAPAATSLEDHCDIGAANLRDFAAKTAEECRSACEREDSCAAFTHISGWNRCFLKKSPSPKTTVKMYSGEIESVEGVRGVAREGEALDHNGKDWQKHLVDLPADCRNLCLEAPQCQAFTLIGGYRTCWLKKTTGTLRSKIFRCGVKIPG